jgi:hypothetical protein
MAQSAVAAISTGCQMLKEGKAEIDKFKKTVEGGVKDAQAIYKEVTGIWGWITGLFGDKPKKPAVSVAVPVEQAKADTKPAKARRKEPEPELTYEEFQARQVHEICENLKVYFEAMRQLKAHCRELEEASLHTEKVAESAIDRIEIEWQMRQLASQLNHAMVYGTPKDLGLGAMYENFLKMYDQILEEQEYARLLKVKKERDKAWQQDLLRRHRIDRAVAGASVLVVVLWMWGTLLSLGWLVKTPSGLWLLLSYFRSFFS